MEVKYAPVYNDFMTDNHRYDVLYGGAGSGKSFQAAMKLVYRCISEGDGKHIFLACRKYRTSIEGSVFRLIRDVIDSMEVNKYVEINQTKMSFSFWNGNMITTAGLDDTEKLKSIHRITGMWVEEAQEVEYEYFKELNRRLRGITKYYKQIIFTFNPTSEELWLKRRFFDISDPEALKQIYTLHTTYKDNPFLDDEYRRVLETEYRSDENDYRIYVEGKWGRIRTGSEYYANFRYSQHVSSCTYNPDESLHLSWDFNVNPYLPFTVWQIIYNADEKLYECNCIDEVANENPNNTTERACEVFLHRYEDKLKTGHGLFIYGDASGSQRNTSSQVHNYDVIERMLRKYLSNYSMRVPLSNPGHDKRRQFANKIFYGGLPIKIHIDPKCTYLIKDLENVLEDVTGRKVKQTQKDAAGVKYEKYGHFSDTFDYLICSAFETMFNESR